MWAATLIALLAWWAVAAAREALSEHYLVLGYEELGVSPGKAPPPWQQDKWQRAVPLFVESLRYSPGNPWTLQELGAEQLRRVATHPERGIPTTDISIAHANFRWALLQRPTAASLWARVAITKLYLNQVDKAFFDALTYADELGPWDPEVQAMVLFVSLAAWDRLGAEQRAEAIRTLRRAARLNADEAAKLIAPFKRPDLSCEIESAKRNVEGQCPPRRKS